ncbi:MAG: hypothetical protein AAFO74_16670 [Pseudomonadota bacterium]
MKLIVGLASLSLLTLVGCTPSNDAATDAPEEAVISAVEEAATPPEAEAEAEAEADTTVECEGANCDTGGNGRPVEGVDPSH